MNDSVYSAIDARQTLQWGKYLNGLGWKCKQIKNTVIFIRRIPFFRSSVIKIQHPFGPIPFKEIDKLAKEHNAIWAIIEPHVYNYDENDFLEHGYKKSKLLFAHSATIKIDLTLSLEKLFKSFSENARRNIKKSEKFNLEVRPVFMKDQKDNIYFDIFYDLLRNLGKMKKFYVASYDEYHKKITAFKDTSILLFIYENKKPIAVVWFAYFKNVMAYFQTGIIKRGYETLANYLLVWEGLKIAKKLNLEVFDFESIFDPRFPKEVPQYKKYTEFKKRFHGEIIEYPQPMIKIYNRIGRILYICGTLF